MWSQRPSEPAQFLVLTLCAEVEAKLSSLEAPEEEHRDSVFPTHVSRLGQARPASPFLQIPEEPAETTAEACSQSHIALQSTCTASCREPCVEDTGVNTSVALASAYLGQ